MKLKLDGEEDVGQNNAENEEQEAVPTGEAQDAARYACEDGDETSPNQRSKQ